MILVNNIHCERGGRVLFEDLSFGLSPGEALYISGENGVGKSSLIRILAGLLGHDSGSIQFQGQNIAEFSEHYLTELLFIGHQSGINLALTAEQNIKWYQQLAPLVTDQSAMDMKLIYKTWNLYGFEDVAAAKLSAGQQRRIALCRLLFEQKKIWLLDEPLVALDQQGIITFKELAQKHMNAGGYLIFSSHQEIDLGNSMKTLYLGSASTQNQVRT